jgi:transcriptional regulator with GAF, ATPase, and Fis domain
VSPPLQVHVAAPEGQPDEAARCVRALLAAAGVDVLSEPAPDVPVVAALETYRDAAAIRLLREEGHRRLLAATVEPAPAAWDLLDAGASDVVAIDEHFAGVVVARLDRWREIDAILASDLVRRNLVGSNRLWLNAIEELIEVSRFSSKSVLITGESGTGKDLAARLVHTLDRRPKKGQLVILDCTTIVPTLSGSELFGHGKGAFTGATRDRKGAFALADGGTLFLDEIGELPLPMQSELLRVVQEGAYKPVGSDRWERTDFRLVCATNRDLHAMQAAGAFRTDLYHRIAAARVCLPSLESRATDIPALARHFLEVESARAPLELTPEVEAYLVRRRYPGNVRDLKQLVARICCRHVGPGPVTVGDIPREERPAGDGPAWWEAVGLATAVERAVAAGVALRDLKDRVADLAVDAALDACSGNVASAARRLQVTNRAIQLRRARRPRAGEPEPCSPLPLEEGGEAPAELLPVTES